jgi:NADPH-dependent 2,4-dienoyl-CoA reductase/sulfur reductase-like enzyme
MKAALDIPVSVVGGISTLEQAEDIIASGKADIVAMAKALMADPKLVIKGERGQDDDIRPCMRCMYCLRGDGETHLSGCAVNPTLGWEYRYRYTTPKPSSKKVAIAGGGPGGMKAARELTKRGCDVTLYEKSDKLGGRLPEASSLWLKDGFRRYFEYAVRKTESCGAKIEKGVTLTPEILKEQKPDVLIVATGGQSLRPNIPGIDGAAVYDVADVDRGLEVTGENILVCGAGLSGTEAAFELARAGKKVSLVDMRAKEEIYDGFIFFMMPQILLKLKEFGITTYDRTKIKEFAEGKVVCESEDGSTLELAADAFVLALGLAPDKAAIEALTDEVAESYIIGDAGGQGMIGDAVVQAYYACEQV